MTLADDIFGASSDARVQLAMLMAASGLESSMLWNPAPAVNPNDPGGSFGPFQINAQHFGEIAPNGVVIDAQTAQDSATAVSFMLSRYQSAVQQFSAAQWQQDPAGTAGKAIQLAEGSTGYPWSGPGSISEAFQQVTGLAPTAGAGIIGPQTPQNGVTFVGDPFGTLKHWLWTGPGPFPGPLKALIEGAKGGVPSYIPGFGSQDIPGLSNVPGFGGLGSIGAFFSTLNKPQLWKSIGLTALAVVVLLVGVVIVVASNKTVQQDVRGAGSTAAMAGA